MIPDDHLKDVCKIGQAECCRYILGLPGGFQCAKFTKYKDYLDARVIVGNIRATGDNCDGLV